MRADKVIEEIKALCARHKVELLVVQIDDGEGRSSFRAFKHGNAGYTNGCRCERCKMGRAKVMRNYRRRLAHEASDGTHE